MHMFQLSLRAVPTGTLAAQVSDLIADHHRKVHGFRASTPLPEAPAIHLANFQVHPGHWLRWQQTIGGLLDFQLQELPSKVVVASPPVEETVAGQGCWGFHVLDDCLSEMVARVQDLELQYRMVSGGLPFLCIIAGPDLKTADAHFLADITKLMHSGPLELKAQAELVSGRIQPANVRRNLTPYQLPIKAVLKAHDVHPGVTPDLRVSTHA